MVGISAERLDAAKLFLFDKVFIPFAMVIVGVVLFQPLESWWVGPEKYIIYLVGNKNDEGTQRIFRSVQSEAALTKLRFDGREIEVEEEDDEGDIGKARQKASDIIADPRTLVVIGHVSSDITREVLPQYVSASPAVPIITTRESTPKLLDKVQMCLGSENYCPIIQLSPTDDQQAQTMVQFAARNGRKKFIVVEEDDENHKAYNEYLSSALREQIGNKRTDGLELVSTSKIFATSSYFDALMTIQTYKPDCLLYIGGPETLRHFEEFIDAKILAGNLQKTDRPMMIADDGAVSDGLLLKPPNDPIYLLHQFTSEEYRQHDDVYGQDAFSIIGQLVQQSGEHPDFSRLGILPYIRHLINMHRVEDARETIRLAMEDNAHNSTTYVGLKHREYRYYARYKRVDAHFHVWRIDGVKIDDDEAAMTTITESKVRYAGIDLHQ